MKISAKGRYALAACIILAQNYDTKGLLSVISISEQLNLSKIYLEQVFSLLKRANIVQAVKGAQGGYQLAKKPQNITVCDILMSVENALFEKTEQTLTHDLQEIEKALQTSVFSVLDLQITQTLSHISLEALVRDVETHKDEEALMFFI